MKRLEISLEWWRGCAIQISSLTMDQNSKLRGSTSVARGILYSMNRERKDALTEGKILGQVPVGPGLKPLFLAAFHLRIELLPTGPDFDQF
ncbi:hypothetical protein TNCV_2136801 [Trichonephila clavipes]|nr:hypothetical protein TNCV_2136801 [Trichonephila clavipes]